MNAAANKPTSVSKKTKRRKPNPTLRNCRKPEPIRNSAFRRLKKKTFKRFGSLAVRQPELPIVSMNMVFKSGGTFRAGG
jgi:hypothetical protein